MRQVKPSTINHTNTNWNLVQFGTEKVAALKQWHWNFENASLSRFELKFFPALRRRAIRSKLFSPPSSVK